MRYGLSLMTNFHLVFRLDVLYFYKNYILPYFDEKGQYAKS